MEKLAGQDLGRCLANASQGFSGMEGSESLERGSRKDPHH